MQPEQAAFEYMKGLFSLITDNTGLWYLFGPPLTITIIVMFLNWAWRAARGQSSATDLGDEIRTSAIGLDARLNGSSRRRETGRPPR